MAKSGNEAFYDDEIAPALAKLAARCGARGMSLVAVVEYEVGGVGITRQQQERTGPQFSLAAAAAWARGNIDGLILALLKGHRAVSGGSGSLFLSQIAASYPADTPPETLQ